jgi:hypothetical protein
MTVTDVSNHDFMLSAIGRYQMKPVICVARQGYVPVGWKFDRFENLTK